MKVFASNKRAFHNYEIVDKIEAGIVLSGGEVKSIKSGHISLKGAYIAIVKEEAYLLNAHVPPYKYGRNENYEPTRSRKLLLKKDEIKKLMGKAHEKGQTLMPIEIYEKNGKVKVLVGLGRGTKKYEKRDKIKKKDLERDLQRSFRGK